MKPSVGLTTTKVVASATVVSESHKPYSPNRPCAAVIALQIIPLLWQTALAQGDTGPPGLQGLDELLILLIVYPFLGLGLTYLLFKASGKAWVFFLAPLFYVGLSIIAPVDPTATQPQTPAFFSLAGVWFYWTHIVAVAVVYLAFARTNKSWLFLLAPMLGWTIQIISLVFIVAAH